MGLYAWGRSVPRATLRRKLSTAPREQTTHPSYAKHGGAGATWCTRCTGTLHRCCTCMPRRHNRYNQRKRGDQLRCGCYLEREIRWCVTLSSHLYITEGSGPSATDNTPELREDERCKHDNHNGGTIVVGTREWRLHAVWISRSRTTMRAVQTVLPECRHNTTDTK